MAEVRWSIFELPAPEVTYDVVARFVEDAVDSNLVAESLTVEFKERRSGSNVAEAVAALANTEGGLSSWGSPIRVAAATESSGSHPKTSTVSSIIYVA